MGNIASRYNAADNNQTEAIKAMEDARDGASPTIMSSSESEKKEKKGEEDREDETMIPIDIVEDLLQRIDPKEAVGLSIICMHWRSTALAFGPTPGTTPWKVIMTQSQSHLHFLMFSATHPGFYLTLKSLSFTLGVVKCFGSWYGWLVLHRLQPSEQLTLFNPFSGARIDLPRIKHISFVLFVTSDPTAPDCIVVARCFERLLFWRSGDVYWTEETVQDRLTNCDCFIRFKEQFLLLNPMDQFLLSLEFCPFQSKELSLVFGNINLCGAILVESEGELLAFRLAGHPFRVSLFRLDWSTMTFGQMKGLGVNRAVFLSNEQGFSVSAREAGCAGNCIYFFDDSWPEDSCYVHCFEDCSLSSIPHPRLLYNCSDIKGQTWIFPPTVME